MAHDPNNPACHHPPRRCICGITSVLPVDSPVAPALLLWAHEARESAELTAETAWLAAAPHFERAGVRAFYPDDPAVFVDILNYAAPLFAADRAIRLDTSHVAIDGIIAVAKWRGDHDPLEDLAT